MGLRSGFHWWLNRWWFRVHDPFGSATTENQGDNRETEPCAPPSHTGHTSRLPSIYTRAHRLDFGKIPVKKPNSGPKAPKVLV